MTIFLVGYMYSGKSSVGRRLATMLDYTFTDLDSFIEERYHTTVSLCFSRYGEAAFRKLEADSLRRLSLDGHRVVSTGGGTPCYESNMDFILANGVAVWLNASKETIMQRLAKSQKRRPLLANLSVDERALFVERQLKEREPYYSRAQVVVCADGSSLDETVARLYSQLQSYI